MRKAVAGAVKSRAKDNRRIVAMLTLIVMGEEEGEGAEEERK